MTAGNRAPGSPDPGTTLVLGPPGCARSLYRGLPAWPSAPAAPPRSAASPASVAHSPPSAGPGASPSRCLPAESRGGACGQGRWGKGRGSGEAETVQGGVGRGPRWGGREKEKRERKAGDGRREERRVSREDKDKDEIRGEERRRRVVRQQRLPAAPQPSHSIFLSVKVTRKVVFIYTEITLLLYISKQELTSLPLWVTQPRGDKYPGSFSPPLSPVRMVLGSHQLRSKAAHFLGLAYEFLLQVFHLPAESRGGKPGFSLPGLSPDPMAPALPVFIHQATPELQVRCT